MESFLIYIGKVALAAGTFYLLYLALFQHQKHFVFNRIYLPVSLAVSFIIPLITFTTVKYIAPVQIVASNSFAYLPEVAEIVEPAFVYQWYHYLTAIYALGIFAFFIHLFIGHFRAISIIRLSQLKELFGTTVNVSSKDIHPFSFFNKIVLSEKTLDNPSLEVIVQHENIHVKEKHTLDILFAEILFLFQWFNPFAWLIKAAMRNNLEYKTDHQIAQINNAEAYQLAMVGLVHKKGVAPFLTALNGSQLKNRIIMMKKKTENKYALLKQLVVLPLLAILVMGLSNKEIRTEFVEAKKEVKIVVDGAIIPNNHPDLKTIDFERGFNGGEITTALGIDEKVVSNTLSVSDNKLEFTYYVQTTDYVRGTNREFEEHVSSSKMEEKEIKPTKSLFAVDGKILSEEEAKNIDQKEFESAVVLSGKHATNKYGEEVKDASVMDLKTGKPNVKFSSKKKRTITGKVTDEKGEPISGAMVLINNSNIGTVTNENGDYVIESESLIETLRVVMVGYGMSKTRPKSNAKTNIVLKAPTEKRGANSGKVEIRMVYKMYGTVSDEQGNPIAGVNVLVSGKNVGTVSDTNGKYSIAKSGSGEILVFSKQGFQAKKTMLVNGENNVVLKTNQSSESNNVIIKGLNNSGSNKNSSNLKFEMGKEDSPLFVVDGVIVEYKPDIKSEDIEAVTILKGESATSIYGEKGKNGVVLINTKKSGIKGHNHTLKNSSEIKVVGYGKQKDDIIAVGFGEQKDKPERIRLSADTENPPLYFVDGKEVASIENLKSESIESMSILKDESAESVYGERAKNGVVLIETKKAKKVDATGKIIIVDGKEFEGNLNDIDPKDISSIEVKKNQADTNIYDGKGPEKDKIIIQTKTKYNAEKKPLVLVDGVPHAGNIDDIKPENIESISVLKDASAVANYGAAAKNGAILITTKKKIITSELQLRKFIAEKIRYPLKPQEHKQEGVSKIYFKITESGLVTSVSDEKVKDAIRINEVVVVGYKTGADDEIAEEKLDDYSKYFNIETKHVIYQLGKIDIEEYLGKTIAITVKFQMQ